MSEVVGLAWFDFEPGERERWWQHASELVKAVNAEPGCVYMDIVLHPTSPTKAIGYSRYESVEAFNDHLASEHIARFGSLTRDIRVRAKKTDWFHADGFPLGEQNR